MDYVKGIEPVTVLKTRSAELIRRTRETGQPVIITQNGRPTAVLVDVETFQRQRHALLLLKALVQGDQAYTDGRRVSQEEANERLRKTLARLRVAEPSDG